eukprot:TRINITY_DN30445_c0_g1_i1.p1 TRINITY_DN30445_c0_g1~~TRINITY_DN30445_c0_g1_i1.p1  ORF type:complete len:289 (+),score=45.24 TRINITY_DN30445_c0_g1_i1:54-920(+)
MLGHRIRCSPGTDSAGSLASSVSLNSPKDFHEVKELVKDVHRRLTILEKVFLFVDIDQINHVIAEIRSPGLGGKAGSDSTLSAAQLDTGLPARTLSPQRAESCDSRKSELAVPSCDWQCLPDGLGVRNAAPSPAVVYRQDSAGVNQSKCPYPPLQAGRNRLQPLGQTKALQSSASLMPMPLPTAAPAGFRREAPERGGRAAADDGKTCGTSDDVEKSLRSTGSTTAFGSTCREADEEIEPERCHQFMRQALQSAKTKQSWMDRVNRMREKPAGDASKPPPERPQRDAV